MPHQYPQPAYDQMHMAQRQGIPSGSTGYGAAPMTGQFAQPMHMAPPTQMAVPAPQPKPIMSTANLQTMSVRSYLDATVVPTLLEGNF